jgi:uncharacterized RDD family membrane protein YckC
MECPNCNKEVVADSMFCTWCDAFIPNPQCGNKAGIFRRFLATAIDPTLAILIYFTVVGVSGGVAGSLFGDAAAVLAIVIAVIACMVFFWWFLGKGMTPGKWLLGLQVIEKHSGEYPGLLRMIIRETFGKFLSGLFLGIGYFWAIWDKDAQAWHDKIAGTVVVRRL